MASVNKWIGVGYTCNDTELRYLASGEAVASITVACNDSYKDKTTGEKKETTEFVRVVFFSKLAEIAGQFLKKGAQVYVEGSLRTRKYTDKSGVEKYVTEVRGDVMKMLGSKPQDQGAPRQPSDAQRATGRPASHQAQQSSRPAPNFSDMDDDIPFLLSNIYINDGMGTSKSMMRAKSCKQPSIVSANQGEF